MERMDRARRIGGLLWVGAGLVFGVGWAVLGGVAPGAVILVLAAAALLLAAVVAGPGTGPTARWLAGWVVTVLLAAEFAGAVADRFGAFGPPGASGVSWGSWPVFVEYTATLLHDPAQVLVVAAAVGATVAEVVLAVALLSGWQRRWVGKAAAGLLAVYLVAMATSVGWDDVATYALPAQIGAALLVTVCPARRPAGEPVTAAAPGSAGA
jgi:hypothetical protein